MMKSNLAGGQKLVGAASVSGWYFFFNKAVIFCITKKINEK